MAEILFCPPQTIQALMGIIHQDNPEVFLSYHMKLHQILKTTQNILQTLKNWLNMSFIIKCSRFATFFQRTRKQTCGFLFLQGPHALSSLCLHFCDITVLRHKMFRRAAICLQLLVPAGNRCPLPWSVPSLRLPFEVSRPHTYYRPKVTFPIPALLFPDVPSSVQL